LATVWVAMLGDVGIEGGGIAGLGDGSAAREKFTTAINNARMEQAFRKHMSLDIRLIFINFARKSSRGKAVLH
jgi:hypothetical protein